MIFSHSGEVGATCDVCGKKFLHKHFNCVRAGHQNVCLDPACIVHAMHETGTPVLTLGDSLVNTKIAQFCNKPTSIVDFHTDIARAVYQVFNNPHLISFEQTLLLEAIVANEFASHDSNELFKYSQTIDVMYKPLGVPTGRKSIDTNYPFTAVVAGGAKGKVLPGVLISTRQKYNGIGYPYGKRIDEYKPEDIAVLSSFDIIGCPSLPISKGTIILGQLYLYENSDDNIFENEYTFSRFIKLGLYDKKVDELELKMLHCQVMDVVHNENNFYTRQDKILKLVNNYIDKK